MHNLLLLHTAMHANMEGQEVLTMGRSHFHVFLLQVTFEQDVVITQMNEYEVLQLLMGECRDRLAAYKTTLEEDAKLLQVSEHAFSHDFCGVFVQYGKRVDFGVCCLKGRVNARAKP